MSNLRDGSNFMRPLALGWTAYLFGFQALFLITRGGFHSPDSWAEVYTLILGTYAGAPEVKRWVSKVEQGDEPDDWLERLRKGGPLIIAWNGLLAAAGALRMFDPSWPMPPELKSITMQVTALFFGTYALRQVRRRKVRESGGGNIPEGDKADDSDARQAEQKQAILEYLRKNGPSKPSDLAQALLMNRRTLGRLIALLVAEKAIERQSQSPTDPAARYAIRP